MMETTTPMLAQYQAIKAQHRDCILFFRLGDFYEMFFDDAKVASQVLDLVLTSRGKGTANSAPMCGIPYHSAEGYIAKLIKAGLKVAICEQLEDPAAAKGIVKRDVIRVITSGTYLDEHSTDARYLLCLSAQNSWLGMALIDPTSGTIHANQYQSSERIIEVISKLPVQECIFSISQQEIIKTIFEHPLLRIKNITFSPHEDWCFNPEIAQKTLCEHFKVHNLSGFGIEGFPMAASCAGGLLEYLRQMNKQPLRHIDRISLYTDSDYVYISPAATYGLELENLFKMINRTSTAMGKRLLQYWLYHPLRKPANILQRQAAVRLLKEDPESLKTLREILGQIPDIEKCLSKLSCGYLQARDLLGIRNALTLIPRLQQILAPLVEKNRLFILNDLPQLRTLLENAINPDMPLANAEGKVIKKGFHAELDALRDIQENGRQWLQQFQEQEIRRTGINSLKVGYNRVFGYYIEITKTNLTLAPQDYIRKQTLANGERFITPELKEYEDRILNAQDKILKIENTLVRELQNEILNETSALHDFGQTVAAVDALCALGLLAQQPHYTAPRVTEETVIDIKEGRHPVVEKMLAQHFVPNDIFLDCDQQHLIILTGPNMAGKSTYIRQVALLTILAQMGSYVPAESAHIGIVDKIFTRIGAHDDISKGQSTFMVEMNEMADILNNLSDRSLVILDEIGRGTSTYDGLSLAWALVEHLQKTKARTLFATHFHELTALANEYSGVKNYNVAVKEWQDEVIFLHKIVAGSTDDSYGIYVAKLAGIPSGVILRAKKILGQLESQRAIPKPQDLQNAEEQLSLFAGSSDPRLAEIKEHLENMVIDQMTPLQALNKLQELKKVLNHDRQNSAP